MPRDEELVAADDLPAEVIERRFLAAKRAASQAGRFRVTQEVAWQQTKMAAEAYKEHADLRILDRCRRRQRRAAARAARQST